MDDGHRRSGRRPDDETGPVSILLLGPTSVATGDAVMSAGAPRRCTVLAVLALSMGSVVSRTALTDALWGADLPENAAASIQTYVWGLRRLLGPELLQRSGEGYRLVLPRAACDALRAQDRLGRAARVLATGDDTERLRAAQSLEETLALWRGTPLPESRGSWGDAARNRLHGLRLDIVRTWAELLLAAGRPARVASELRRSIDQQPDDEELSRLLMLALQATGRRREALQEYERLREQLRTVLGIDPDPRLRRLYTHVLATPDLPAPGVRSAEPPPPAQLPPFIEGFVGRAGEEARLKAWLGAEAGEGDGDGDDFGGDSPVVVVVDGPGGIGKSALAVRVAHAVAANYPDGQLYADLHARHRDREPAPADVLPGFLRALGAPAERIPATEPERSSLLRTMLAGRRVLILLDDVPSAEAVRRLLPGTPGCAVLVTSRLRLPGLVLAEGAHRLTLGPLADAEAVALLRRHLGRSVVENPGAAEELARLCGNWPLALRVVCEMILVHGPDLPLLPVAAQMRLAGDGWLEALRLDEDDSTAVEDVLSWSYRQLPDDDSRRLYRLLGDSVATVDQDVVMALLDVPADRAAALLRVLTARHLLQPVPGEPGRLEMHDLIRRHARVRSQAEGPAAPRPALGPGVPVSDEKGGPRT